MKVAGMVIDLPETWQWATCSEVIDVRDGTHDTPKYVSQGYPLVTSKNLKPEGIDFSTITYISEKEHRKISRRSRVDRDDILFAMIGTIGNPVLVDIDPEFSIKNVALFKFADSPIDPRYFKHLLKTQILERQLDFEERGGTQKFVSLKVLRNMMIPYPSLEEQRRIAAILDKADGVRRKRKEAIALTEDLLRSAFLEMFGDPVTNPKGWEIGSMRDVIQNIRTEWSASGEDKPLDEGEWGVLKISAVTTGQFISTEHKNVGKPPFKNPTIVPKKGDLLFTRANTRELVAATCLVEKDCENIFLPDKIWSIETTEEIITREYLRFLLAEPKYRSLITKKATVTSGSMLNVSQKKLLEMNAPIPPIDLQKKFSNFVWKSLHLRKNYEFAAEHSDSEFNSLLQRAFCGEL
jgi:type I restriction enzyme, S subunit